MKSTRAFTFLLTVLFLCSSCACTQNQRQDRIPAVAGQFYPADSAKLVTMLRGLFAQAAPSKHIPGVGAIICPHAGYVYSGQVAASSYNQLDENREYENVFILGPSHYVGFEGASVYDQGDFITPMGVVKVNRELGKKLIRTNSVFSDRSDAHLREHSIEVQLPFLQYFLRQPFRIVPIVFGADNIQTCAKIARALKPYFNTKNLFVISTDFSHYPSYADAEKIDKTTGDAVLSNSVQTLASTLQANDDKNIPNLATSMCGWSCVLTLLSITQDFPQVTYTPIEYRNSGDISGGDQSRVVGYYSIVIAAEKPESDAEFQLNDADKKTLLRIARTTIEQLLGKTNATEIDTATLSTALKAHCGAFVTLNERHQLRGCIGRFGADEPLYKVVQDMAIAAASQDYRFSPVRKDELNSIEVEISVLTPLKLIHSIDEIQLGKNGIYVRKGNRSGTFLPQVATETGWTKEEFLGHCAQDKAGIGWNGWKEAEIYTYEALVFGEEDSSK